MRFLFFFLLTGLLACAQDAPTTDSTTDEAAIYERLDTPTFLAQLQVAPNAQLLDVRTPGEYAHGAVENATLINIQDENFVENVQQVFKTDQPLYVYCQAGGRSKRAAQQLQAAGFTEIYELRDGYRSISR